MWNIPKKWSKHITKEIIGKSTHIPINVGNVKVKANEQWLPSVFQLENWNHFNIIQSQYPIFNKWKLEWVQIVFKSKTLRKNLFLDKKWNIIWDKILKKSNSIEQRKLWSNDLAVEALKLKYDTYEVSINNSHNHYISIPKILSKNNYLFFNQYLWETDFKQDKRYIAFWFELKNKAGSFVDLKAYFFDLSLNYLQELILVKDLEVYFWEKPYKENTNDFRNLMHRCSLDNGYCPYVDFTSPQKNQYEIDFDPQFVTNNNIASKYFISKDKQREYLIFPILFGSTIVDIIEIGFDDSSWYYSKSCFGNNAIQKQIDDLNDDHFIPYAHQSSYRMLHSHNGLLLHITQAIFTNVTQTKTIGWINKLMKSFLHKELLLWEDGKLLEEPRLYAYYLDKDIIDAKKNKDIANILRNPFTTPPLNQISIIARDNAEDTNSRVDYIDYHFFQTFGKDKNKKNYVLDNTVDNFSTMYISPLNWILFTHQIKTYENLNKSITKQGKTTYYTPAIAYGQNLQIENLLTLNNDVSWFSRFIKVSPYATGIFEDTIIPLQEVITLPNHNIRLESFYNMKGKVWIWFWYTVELKKWDSWIKKLFKSKKTLEKENQIKEEKYYEDWAINPETWTWYKDSNI